jgi:hypothetical protein
VHWRVSPLVIGLALAPLVPVWQAIEGVAPSVTACQWQLDLMCLGGEQGEGFHVVSEWLVFMPWKHWWKLGQCRRRR